jgi:hypothetical protein
VNNKLTPAESFIARWQGVTASELATAQRFVIEAKKLKVGAGETA